MKLNTLFLGCCMTIGSICNAQEATTVITEGLRFCESTYPLEDEILITNFGSSVLNPLNSEGKGYIQSYTKGTVRTFIPATGELSAPKGMYVKDNMLYVCDVNKIVVYDLSDREKSKYVIHFPTSEMMLNGIVGDGIYIYVSVTDTGNIFRFKAPKSSDSLTVSPDFYLHIPGANGLAMQKGSMYVASYPVDEIVREENRIYKIADVNKPVVEKLPVKPGKYDGLAFSADGKVLYASNWDPLEVVAIDLISGNAKTLQIKTKTAVKGLAAMSVIGDSMFIPDLPNSRVIEVPLKTK